MRNNTNNITPLKLVLRIVLRLLMPFFLSTLALSVTEAQLLNGKTLQPAHPQEIIEQVKPGSILILGENHGIATHRDQHVLLLNMLHEKGLKVSVGLEFLNYTDQAFVDQYLSDQLTDDQFQKSVQWQSIGFEFYKQQLRFPKIAQGFSLGLNIPRSVTSKIAKTGIEGLKPEELKLMPPQFQLGRDSYKKRFADVIHVPAGSVLDRYFTAQSTWDDTMAWQAIQFIHAHPDQVLVIVVGEFHAQFGGGLANRIQARDAVIKITSVSQIWAVKSLDDGTKANWTDEEIQSEIKPSVDEGPRGDFIWVSKPLLTLDSRQ